MAIAVKPTMSGIRRRQQQPCWSSYGLGSITYAGDTARARRLASRIEAGMVYINTPASRDPSCRLVASKGPATVESSANSAIEEFANRKLVVVGAS